MTLNAFSDQTQQNLSCGRRCDTIYETEDNVCCSVNQVLANTRYQIALPTLQLGASGATAIIANASCLDHVQLYVELPHVGPNCLAPKGWLLAAVSRIDMLIGGATVLTANRPQILSSLMRQAETKSKRSDLLKMAGEAITDEQDEDQVNVAVLPLSTVFFCTVRYLGKHIPYDSTLLALPLQLVIYWNRAEDIFSGGGPYPPQFSKASLVFRQLDFKSQDQSLRSALLQNPSMYKGYSFYFPFIFNSPNFVGSVDSSNPCRVNLLSFRSGNLASISVWVQPVQNNASTAIRNPLYYEDISDVVLEYNSQIIYQSALSEQFSFPEGLDKTVYPYSYAPQQIGSPYTLIPVEGSWCDIVLSQFNDSSFEGLIQSGSNYSSQVVNLSFTTLSDEAVTYSCQCAYNYLVTCVSSNLNATLVF